LYIVKKTQDEERSGRAAGGSRIRISQRDEPKEKAGTYPSSIVSSAAKRTMSNPSKTLLFSTCPLNNKLTASLKALRARESWTSFDVAKGPTMWKWRSVVDFVRTR
jgi:hypothetical protein